MASAVLLLVGRGRSLGIVPADDYEQFRLDPDVARVVESAGFMLIVAAVTALLLLALSVGVVARQTRTLVSGLALPHRLRGLVRHTLLQCKT